VYTWTSVYVTGLIDQLLQAGGRCRRRIQLVEKAQTTLVVLEYIWMCLSDEFIVSSSTRQLLDKFENIMHIIMLLRRVTVFFVRCVQIRLLTYFGFICSPQKFNFNT